jgi:hypothetical protein
MTERDAARRAWEQGRGVGALGGEPMTYVPRTYVPMWQVRPGGWQIGPLRTNKRDARDYARWRCPRGMAWRVCALTVVDSGEAKR